MADSLRDQLIAAGFEAPKKPVKKNNSTDHGKSHRKKSHHKKSHEQKGHGKKGRPNPGSKTADNKPGAKAQKKNPQPKDATAEAAIAERKRQKAQIKELIDSNKLENWKGDIAYRYTVEKRIRELYVNEAAQKHLTARKVAITRLNGDTYLIPIETADKVININPQWSVFNAEEVSDDKNTEDDEYSEFQVPDDLQW